MKKFILYFVAMSLLSFATSVCWARDDIHNYPSCPLCGMDRGSYAHSRMLLQYDDRTSLGTCSIHCAAMELAVNRHKTITVFYAADYTAKKLIDARKAFWVIGGSKPGVMTRRAKWAFEKRSDAEDFTRQHGGTVSVFDDAMSATFQDMYDDIKLIRQRRSRYAGTMQDIKEHPECKYCGMKRELYAFSRMLVKYSNGTAVGTCSIHCSSIDLALNPEKKPEVILVGDFNTKRLIDAERAFWVIGGQKVGVMSIKGKWAFEEIKDADAFIRANGGHISSFDEAMKVTFEDMHEILR
ncbi:MAG: nitrous oxide reductase accessory protein NosL [Syntrophaceae bacterium]